MTVDAGALREVRAAYHAGGLVPFVGAGVSMSVEWTDADGHRRRGPSWGELVDEAARQLGFAEPDLLRARGEDLQILEYFKIKHDGRLAPLTNWMVREFAPDRSVLDSNPIYISLASLLKCRSFYTTNFDNFLEEGLRSNGRAVATVATETEIRNYLSGRIKDPDLCEVIKFHGDLDHPDTMVVTDSDYRSRLALETTMDRRFSVDLLGRMVLFIGYSFRDWNVSYLFHVINSIHGSLPLSITGRRAFIFVSDPSEFEVALFEKRGIGVVPTGLMSRTDDIAEFIAKISEEA